VFPPHRPHHCRSSNDAGPLITPDGASRLTRTTSPSSDASNPRSTRTRTAPISTTISETAVSAPRVRTGKNRGGSFDDGVLRSARARAWTSPAPDAVSAGHFVAPRNCDAAQLSVDALHPLVAANSFAERPLARHSRIRSTHFASVSFVMPGSLPMNRSPRKNASLRSGYIAKSRRRSWAKTDRQDCHASIDPHASLNRSSCMPEPITVQASTDPHVSLNRSPCKPQPITVQASTDHRASLNRSPCKP